MNTNVVKYQFQKLYRRVVQFVGSRWYVDSDPDSRKCILVAGTARSGTTWLADLITSQLPCRLMFEPFHPKLVPEYAGFNYFQFMPPGQQCEKLYAFAQRVISGDIRNRWIDRKNEQIFPRFRLVKEIRANLLLKWLHDHFPEVPILFIIRHPCAVVLSRIELGWATDTDIEPLLQQPDLVAHYLDDKLDLIRSVTHPEEKHAMIWSICNLVPLAQFRDNGMSLIYYEHLCTQAEVELPRLFESIHQNYDQSIAERIMVPSSTTRRTSAVITGEDKIARWKKTLTTAQIDRILRVVESFGLAHLYGDSLLPLNSS